MRTIALDHVTWRNCWADVGTYSHKATLENFIKDVVEPGLASLDSKITEYAEKGGAWEAFAVPDLKAVRRETTVAFSLAIQSIWERQLRGYLQRCVAELYPKRADLHDMTQSNKWVVVEALFLNLRGVALTSFPSYSVLSTLHLLGNAARHGEGQSVTKLRREHPEFWPEMPFGDYTPLVHLGKLLVTLEHLRHFSEAIGAFWDEIEIIRLRSLNSKDDRIHRGIEELIRQRKFVT
ncbi:MULTISPECIES: hypothetical protein [Agrobacterium]|uniref:Uncharacterized protein n=1 Tax=Agrobacterium tumefaciens TaxID=358 RepID=A0AAE6BGD0_AGRTU|nr:MULTISPECIES: hypothetical protein [Agrobacterium]QCL76869.1 hypothetical protein CFBP5499_25640 [Agrobacterium tumefaciens]QCL82375.1 hypothetical protein CFBP5877_24890 [Agrobacterium tumefaciens]CUX70552.1 conserved hypothetical protein [Agrobacterium sp. NCPPB 925]